MLIYGINPVLEALRAARVLRVRVGDRDDRRMSEIVRLAERAGVTVERVPLGVLNHAAAGGRHQGVVAELEPPREYTPSELAATARGVPLIVVLDGVEDPHNVGAILRTADAAGVDGVVRQSRRAASLSGAAAKASAGAVAYVRIAEVVNIARALEELKAAGVWTVGLAGDAEQRYDEIDLMQPTALVLGAEGTGLRRLVRERCDWLARIPMAGHVENLNVSVAAAVVLFEAIRQRRMTKIQRPKPGGLGPKQPKNA
jgi:23S rRNA (guanosine2251-2'-O)-methyltransferase